MKRIVFAVILLCQQCLSQPIEDSVVSVYTTHPTTMGTSPPLDVYHQIANNLAERITSPIYRFLGINSTKPETTTKSWDKIELLDDADFANKHEMKPIDNDISRERDVEDLTVEGIQNQKTDKKPEKITLYSSYLPVLGKASQFLNNNSDTAQNEAKNDTSKEVDDAFDWDFEEQPAKPREGPFIYMLEFFGNILQLVWGGLTNLFKTSSGSGSRDSS